MRGCDNVTAKSAAIKCPHLTESIQAIWCSKVWPPCQQVSLPPFTLKLSRLTQERLQTLKETECKKQMGFLFNIVVFLHLKSGKPTRFLRVSGTALTSTGSRSMALMKRASATAMAQMTWTHLIITPKNVS